MLWVADFASGFATTARICLTKESATTFASSANKFTKNLPLSPNEYRPEAIISVKIIPGEIVWTPTLGPPASLTSTCRVLLSCPIPALVKPYVANIFVGLPSDPAPSKLKMCPPSGCSRNILKASLQHRSVPKALVMTTSRTFPTSASTRFSYTYALVPALLMTMSIPPICSFANENREVTDASSLTSQVVPHTFRIPPLLDIVWTTCMTCFSFLEHKHTQSPSWTNFLASASPSPFVAPVMSTRFPPSRRGLTATLASTLGPRALQHFFLFLRPCSIRFVDG
mmetsp:Transcript_8422/g.52644  ORF Transcript_8422/g.52644 Transcript_8422/m.52644 type:complete len:283 (+) Transcript_8422:958-1806(+)